jgi:O-antigen ligase
MLDTPTIKPTKALWMMMLFSIMASPLTPDPRGLGFYSVEFSFFFFGGLFGWLTVLIILKRGMFKFSLDPSYYFFIAFLIICILSMVDAPNKLRGTLVTFQYLPYFFIFIMCVTLLQQESQLDQVLGVLTNIAFFYSVMIFVLSLMYNNRGLLDLFLGRYFVQDTTKILIYMELVFCLLTYRAFHGHLSKYEWIVLISIVLSVFASGGRTNMGVMGVVFGLSFLKSKNFIRKSAIILLLIGSFLFMFFTVDYVKTRVQLMFVTSSRDYEQKITAFSRVYTTEVALQVIKTHPFNGAGIGNLSYYTMNTLKTIKGIPRDILYYWNQHVLEGKNVYETTITPIKYAAEMGPLGFIFFFAFYWYLWKRITSAIMVTSGEFKITLLGLRMFVMGSLVHNLLDPGITNYYSWFYYGLVIAGSRIAYSKYVEKEDMKNFGFV